jgi:hypothetical protein
MGFPSLLKSAHLHRSSSFLLTTSVIFTSCYARSPSNFRPRSTLVISYSNLHHGTSKIHYLDCMKQFSTTLSNRKTRLLVSQRPKDRSRCPRLSRGSRLLSLIIWKSYEPVADGTSDDLFGQTYLVAAQVQVENLQACSFIPR